MTPAEVYALLHGNAREFGQGRVEAFRAGAERRLREMRGETGALLRWIAANRERIEQNATWAEARSALPTPFEAQRAAKRLIASALGGEVDANGWVTIDSPGYDVTVDAEVWPKSVLVTLAVRTEKDKPVYFAWNPTPEQIAAAAKSKASYRSWDKRPKAERLAKDKQPLTRIDLYLPLNLSEFGTGIYDASPVGEKSEEGYEAFNTKNRLFKGRHDPKTQKRLSDNNRRVSVPALESGEATFDLAFRSSPGREPGYDDLILTVPGVTLETLANVLFDTIGVGFPNSPYFKD